MDEQELYKFLDLPAYTLAEVSRLSGLSTSRVARWLKGYRYKYPIAGGEITRVGRQEAVIRRQGTKNIPYASFMDLIDLLFVKAFLEKGFTLQRLRLALDEARELLGTNHFARQKFFTSGHELFLELPQGSRNVMALMHNGQWAIAPLIIELGHKIDFYRVSGIATRYYPLGRQGHIVIDPRISFGRPSIIGRGIATENVYDLYIGEGRKVEKVSRWLNVPKKEVNAAVRFEQNLYA